MTFATSLALTTSPPMPVGTLSSPASIDMVGMASDHTSLDSGRPSPAASLNTYLCFFLKEPCSAMFLQDHPDLSFLNITVVLLLKHYIRCHFDRYCGHNKAFFQLIFSDRVCEGPLPIGQVSVCLPCQRSKGRRHVRAPLGYLQPPNTRFRHIHVDQAGRRFTDILTCIDWFSRWAEAIPVVLNWKTWELRSRYKSNVKQIYCCAVNSNNQNHDLYVYC